jgi:osmotically-inducible protein OsmY
MALDDSVKARSVEVSTTGTTVTLTGTVRSVAEHDRTIALARETAGVNRVVDHLVLLR